MGKERGETVELTKKKGGRREPPGELLRNSAPRQKRQQTPIDWNLVAVQKKDRKMGAIRSPYPKELRRKIPFHIQAAYLKNGRDTGRRQKIKQESAEKEACRQSGELINHRGTWEKGRGGPDQWGTVKETAREAHCSKIRKNCLCNSKVGGKGNLRQKRITVEDHRESSLGKKPVEEKGGYYWKLGGKDGKR